MHAHCVDVKTETRKWSMCMLTAFMGTWAWSVHLHNGHVQAFYQGTMVASMQFIWERGVIVNSNDTLTLGVVAWLLLCICSHNP